jgi:hypothetical protein
MCFLIKDGPSDMAPYNEAGLIQTFKLDEIFE